MRDFDIRQKLKQTKLIPFFEDGTSRIIDEFSFPSTNCRIDLAVINCSLHGYEIKSSCDTLKRLPKQLEGYEKVLDYLYVVTEPSHVKHVEKLLPEWVGLTICQEYEGDVELIDLRTSVKNPNKEGFHLAKILWRNEIVDILESNGIKFRKKDRNWILCEVLANNLELEFISNEVRNKLKSRVDWRLA